MTERITQIEIPPNSGIVFVFDNTKISKERKERLIAVFEAEMPKVYEEIMRENLSSSADQNSFVP